jgi:hypothetical protein
MVVLGLPRYLMNLNVLSSPNKVPVQLHILHATPNRKK